MKIHEEIKNEIKKIRGLIVFVEELNKPNLLESAEIDYKSLLETLQNTRIDLEQYA